MTDTLTRPTLPKRDVDRFFKYVDRSDPNACWEWQSTISHRGYGKFWLHGRTDLAHRVSYRIAYGPVPKGLLVRHTCDNPPCVNPAHLLSGTGKQNAEDALDRNRYRCGSRNGNARLSEVQVLAVIESYSSGESQVSLARRHGVSRATIQWILNGRTWTRLTGGGK